MTQEKIIQVDTIKLKELFSKFEERDNMFGLLNSCRGLSYSLDENKLFSLSEKIIETNKKIENVNSTLLGIKKMLISGGCLLD